MTISTTLPFELRLKVAQAMIEAQLQRAKPVNRQTLMNGLWSRWINHNVLGKKPVLQVLQGGKP